MQYRHEYKYQINYFDFIILKSRLSAVMKKDLNVDANGEYSIRSIYFDTFEDKALNENIDGVSRREKYRIRCYNEDTDFIRLEKKVKIGGAGIKISEILSFEETKKILSGDIYWMSKDKRELVNELYIKMQYEKLKPKTIVDYKRVPFIYEAGNVRVTLDYDISSANYSTDFFKDNIPKVKPDNRIFILEVKYDNFLPEVIRNIIAIENREKAAFSKYAACRKYTL